MSAPVKFDYAIFLTWLAICSIYTTLLTFTAICVVFFWRKRRSSILKSQRPSRAPFSELEFNVATPTDTAKSRRVSFSRRTGVAEFITNEATTTWQKFYEEHNKTLESSGNESEANQARPSVGSIGKRIFDQQFQDVEAVDYISTLDDGRGRNIETSLNNINFASLECTSDDRKLLVPQQNFELSAFTDHQSKMFGDDLAISGMGELSDRMSVNFSIMQPLSGERDDLDDIQRDLQAQSVRRGQESNVVCSGPFRNGGNLSEYIEFDLNMTNVVPTNDQSDMSITDTIHSPKVQDVSKSLSIDKKTSANKDWVADKENIVVNPYVAPKESKNFAINEEPDKVLVFDGKRLTLQSDIKPEKQNYRQKLLPNNAPDKTPQRKTIVLNVNDDLPNFCDDPPMSVPCFTSGKSMGNQTAAHEVDLSMTQAINGALNAEKRRTIVYGDDTGSISMTQGLPANIVLPDNDRRRTIVYETDSGDISLTQAVSSNNIFSEKDLTQRRKTIVYEDDAGNISITQAVSSNILLSEKIQEKRRTIVFESDKGDISVTQAVPSNIIMPEKRKTLLFDSNLGDISVTNVVPFNLILSGKVESKEKRKTIVFENDAGDISVTQAVPSNIIMPEKRKTIVFDSDLGDISVTNTIPSNIILDVKFKSNDKRKTIVYESDAGDISVTQAVPTNIIIPDKRNTIFPSDLVNLPLNNASTLLSQETQEKRRTILFESDTGDISVTQAMPSNIVMSEKKNTVFDSDLGNLLVTNSSKRLPQETQDKRRTIVFESDTADISVTRAMPSNIIMPVKRKTIVFDSDSGDISVTNVIPSNLILGGKVETIEKRKSIVYESDARDISVTQAVPSNILTEILVEGRETIFHEDDTGNISITQDVPQNFNLPVENESEITNIETQYSNMSPTKIIIPEKRKTIVYQTDTGDISMTQAVPYNIVITNKSEPERRRTVVFESDAGDISVTEAVPSGLILSEHIQANKKVIDDTLNMSVSEALPANSCTCHVITDNEEILINRADFEDNLDTKDNATNKINEDIVTEERKLDVADSESIPDSQPLPTASNIVEDVPVNKPMSFESTTDISSSQPSTGDILGMKQDANDADVSMSEGTDDTIEELKAAANTMETEKECVDMSVTEDIPTTQQALVKRKTIGFEDESRISTPNPIPSDLMSIEKHVYENPNEYKILHTKDNMEQDKQLHGVFVYQTTTENVKLQPEVNKLESIHMSKDTSKLSSPQDGQKVGSLTFNDKEVKIMNESRKSILSDLLDMSALSYDGFVDKEIQAGIDVEKSPEAKESNDNSNDSLFYVTNKDDSDEETQTDNPEVIKPDLKPSPQKKGPPKTLRALEYKQEFQTCKEQENIQEKGTNRKSLPINRRYETVVSSDLGTRIKPTNNEHNSKRNKSFKTVDNTRELIDMLSEFTDQEEEKDPLVPLKERHSLDDVPEPRRLSLMPRRQSVAMSREDLMNNISMAQAVLQKSRVDMTRDDSDESTVDETTEMTLEKSTPPKKVRLSAEVVKTLHFEDESTSDGDVLDPTMSPLKKTAFGETAYMSENKDKANVIPTYLKDVSDGIKQLMTDLVKPVPDVLPFDSGLEKSKEMASTHSLQIQANLITSSQVDLDSDLYSNPESVNTFSPSKKSASQSILKSTETSIRPSTKSSDTELHCEDNYRLDRPPVEQSAQERVIVFDPNNPLNNILLAPIDFSEAHRYDPIKSKSLTDHRNITDPTATVNIERLTTQYNVETNNTYSVSQAGDTFLNKISEDKIQIPVSSSNKVPTDQSVDAPVSVVRDTEVNTIISMKGNAELLEASSSLTLVDDIGARRRDSRLSVKSVQEKSPVHVLHQDRELPERLDSDFASQDEGQWNIEETTAKKRNYSPAVKDPHKCTLNNLEVTPKPASKMQKLSNSPNKTLNGVVKISPKGKEKQINRSVSVSPERKAVNEIRKSHKHSPKKNSPKGKPGTNITVQHLITKCHIEARVDSQEVQSLRHKTNSECNNDTETALDIQTTAKIVLSSSSSNDQSEMQGSVKSTSDSRPTSMTKELSMDWQPELLNKRDLVTECESSINVLTKIDALSFMGRPECVWETRGSEVWTFLLLHGRLRLRVRLARRRAAPPACVRADTPLRDVAVEHVNHVTDKSSIILALCVKFAAAAMQHWVGAAVGDGPGEGAGCAGCAGAVPALLRRCGGAARAAARWARAMRSAHAHLAYTLAQDGRLTLKVANIPLRSVWEVSMVLEASAAAGEAPWPRASHVRVHTSPHTPHTCPPAATATAAAVRRAADLARCDWGHAPSTIWRIFKYLKNKTAGDAFLDAR